MHRTSRLSVSLLSGALLLAGRGPPGWLSHRSGARRTWFRSWARHEGEWTVRGERGKNAGREPPSGRQIHVSSGGSRTWRP